MAQENAPEPSGPGDGAIKIDGERLEFALRITGMSQNALAERAGVNPSHISKAIHGLTRVSPEVYGAILTAFPGTVRWDDFLEGFHG